MIQVLSDKLYKYIVRNNPDLIISTSRDGGIGVFIRAKVQKAIPLWENLVARGCPASITEELCLDMLTRDLKPSLYHYICTLLEAEFEADYQRMKDAGILTYETAILIEQCRQLFDHYAFRLGKEDDKQLYDAVTEKIKEYLMQKYNQRS